MWRFNVFFFSFFLLFHSQDKWLISHRVCIMKTARDWNLYLAASTPQKKCTAIREGKFKMDIVFRWLHHQGGGRDTKGSTSHHGTFDIAVCIFRCVGWWPDKGPNVYPNICRVEKSRSPPLFYISSPGSNLTLMSDRRTISSLVAPLDLYIKSAAVCIRERPENASRSVKDALRLG